jgi:hypothetical protein
MAGTTKIRKVLRQVILGNASLYPCTHWWLRAMTAAASSRLIPGAPRANPGEATAVNTHQSAAAPAALPQRRLREGPAEPAVGPDTVALACRILVLLSSEDSPRCWSGNTPQA